MCTFVNMDDFAADFWRFDYLVSLTAQGIQFVVNASCEQSALDEIMDYLVHNSVMPGLWTDDIEEIEENGYEWSQCGNYGYAFTTHNIHIVEL